MARTRWLKEFTGDLEGTSVVEAIMLQVEPPPGGEASAIYVGIERFECSVHGRKGSFLLTHNATAHGDDSGGEWTIVPGSGGDELTGITGRGEILPDHHFVLDYRLP
ncbi:hypothetical protein GCM10017786_65050 [Amycolatopsis deserti]|uniref:DUF3224 domain-containing protein n=2 Tax=Amycolatopsis deserti TaxID=185696 RepID=A0ABQ3JER4_9PSEU|nr:hypothetical protein GCM10017786_65050 [Amycolatopsis deserti]